MFAWVDFVGLGKMALAISWIIISIFSMPVMDWWDFDMVGRLATAAGWFITSLALMRFGAILRSKRPPAFRIAGIFGVAGAMSLVFLTLNGNHVWFDITRFMAVSFYGFLTYGIWRSGTAAKKLYHFERELTDGSD